MLNRGNNRVLLHEDVLADEEKVKAILLEWGIDRIAIRRLLKEHLLHAQNVDESSSQSKNSFRMRRPRQPHAHD
jgi:hypothetical protein